MIRIVTVEGDVLIEDLKRNYLLVAQPGMTFGDRPEDRCDLLFVTKEASRATININGKDINLGPLSYLRLRPTGRTWWERHGLGYGGDARRWVGKIWLKMGGPTNDTPGPNATIGVRG